MQGYMNIAVRVYAARAQSELKRLEAQVRSLESQLAKASGKTGFIGNKHIATMTKWGNQVQWTGRQLTYNFTLPLALAATAATKWQLANEKAFTQVAKVYGDTAAAADFFQKQQKGLTEEMATQKATQTFNNELKALQKNFRALSDLYGVQQSEVINVAAAWAAAGASGKELAIAVEATMKAIILGDMDAADATKALISIQGQYTLSSTELMRVLAQLNAIENQTGISMQGLIQGFERTAGVARDAGISTRELGALLAALVPAAGSAANAGNALKTIISRLMAPTREANQVMQAMGINTKELSWQSANASERLHIMARRFDALDDAQKNVVSSVVASRWQINKFSVLMRELISTTGYYRKALDATSSDTKVFQLAQRELNTVLSSNPRRLQQIWVILQNASADIIQPLIPYILYLAKAIADAVRWINELPGPVQKAGLAFLVLIAVFGPLIKYFGSTAALIGQFGLVLGHMVTGPLRAAVFMFTRLTAVLGVFMAVWSGAINAMAKGLAVIPRLVIASTVAFGRMAVAVAVIPRMIVTAGRAMMIAWAGTLAAMRAQFGIWLAAMRVLMVGFQLGFIQMGYVMHGAWVGTLELMRRLWAMTLLSMRTTGILMFGTMAAGMRTAFLTALSPKALGGKLLAGLTALGPLLVRALASPWGLAIVAVITLIVAFGDDIRQIFSNIAEWWNDSNNALVESIIKAWYALPEGITNALVAVARVVQRIALQIYEWLSYINPFARHSPSLVENVTAGMAVIKREFAGLDSVGAHIAAAGAAVDKFGRAVAALGLDDFSQDLAQIRKFAPSLAAGYIQLHKTMAVLNRDLAIAKAQVAAQEAVVNRWKAAVDAANAALEVQQDKLDALQKISSNYSDLLDQAKQRLQDWADTPIEGMQAMSDKIFENEMAQKRLRLEMLKIEQVNGPIDALKDKLSSLQGQIEILRGQQADLRSAGAGSEITSQFDTQIAALEKQQGAINDQIKPIQDLQDALDNLARQGEMLDLENSLKFDPLRRQIDAAANSMREMPFDQIMAGISSSRAQVDKYTSALDKANAAVAAQQAVVDRLTAARDAANKRLDAEQAKLDRLKDTYQQIQDAIQGVSSVMGDMTQAAQKVEQARKQKKETGVSPGLEAFRTAKGGNFPDVGGTGAALRKDWSDQSAAIDQLTADLVKRMNDSFAGIDMFGPFKQKWGQFKAWWNQNISPIGAAIKDLFVSAFRDVDWTGFDKLVGFFKSIADGVKTAGGAIKRVFAPAFKLLSNVWALLAPALKEILDSAKRGIHEFWGEVGPALKSLREVVEPLRQAWAQIWPVLKIVLGVLVAGLLGTIRVVLDIIANLIGPFIGMIGGILDGLITIVKGIIKIVAGILTGDLGMIFDGVIDLFEGLFETIWSIIKGAARAIWGVFKGFVEGIVGFFKWLWDTLVGHSIIPDLVKAIIKWFKYLIIIPKWIYDNLIKPVVTSWINFWSSLNTKMGQWWGYIKTNLTNIWTAIKKFFNDPIGTLKKAWSDFWSYINSRISAWWPFIKSNVTSLLENIKNIFTNAVSGIGKIWDKVQEKVSGPITKVKGWINNNLIDPLNKVLKLFNIAIPKMSTSVAVSTVGHGQASAGRLAYGGPVPGRSPHAKADNIPLWGTAGEYMQPVSAVKYYGMGLMDAIRRRAIPKAALGLANGGPVTHAGARGYFLGGLIDRPMKVVQSWMEKGADFAVKKIMNPAIGMIGRTFQSPDFVHRVAVGTVTSIRDAILKFIVGSQAGGGGPLPTNPGLKGALDWARSQVGKPYIWGGVGPNGYDCSGFMSAITNYIQGRPLFRRRFATGSMPAGIFQRGPGAFSVAWFRGNPGHTAGTLNGVNVESRGGRGVVVGPSARGATNSLFNSGIWHLPGYARGGRIGDPPFDYLSPRGKAFMPELQFMGLANGAIVKAAMGGTIARLGEGMRDEAVVPLPRNWRNFNSMASKQVTINIYGNLEFPNIRSGDDVEDLIDGLEILAGDYK